MKIAEYTESALKFAKDSRRWYGMTPGKFYTTEGGDGWAETCDNAHGGLDVSWAFHESAAEIRRLAPQKFVDLLANLVTCGIDGEWEPEGFRHILDLMS